MVGRPPEVRALAEHLICALAVLELQSAGARRSRVTNYALRKLRHDAPAKNEPNKNRQQNLRRDITVQKRLERCMSLERLKVSEIVVSLKGCQAPANAGLPASMIAE